MVAPFNSCCANGFDWYCVKCLWKITKSYPTISIPKSEFATQEDDIMWDEGFWRDIKYDPENDHAKRVANADLSYPILVCLFEEKYEILDGCHRFIKETRDCISAKVVGWDVLNKMII